MKRVSTYALLLAAAFAAGCDKVEEQAATAPAPQSSGLVIEASCSDMARTDIVEGKSSWEVGDAITVIYDGTAYEYTTDQAGTSARFTSTAGIESYDPARPLTAYYPATDAAGTVSVAAQSSVTLGSDPQANAAHAPLVGLPAEMTDNTLNLSFRNIFSVMELRIDAGTLTAKGSSITLEPASAEGFDGYLTFTGTVDPETLALTPAADGTGNTLTVSFNGGADLTRPLTVKFPVGRFKSTDGLKLTLRTDDGAEYSKTIYKAGVESYTEENGSFTPKHMAKALYAMGSDGGIATADDLVAFAAAVNAGESLARWQDADGTINLLADIDMSGVTEWTPIGEASFTWGSNVIQSITGNTFSGHFDGNNHTISNLHMTCTAAGAASNAWGFFGALTDGATVENLVFDKSCSFTVAARAGSDTGIVAGLVYNSTVRNVINNAPMSVSADAAPGDNVRLSMGMVGFAFAGGATVSIDRCMNYGPVSAESAGNTKNGATGLQIAGIVGFATNALGSSDRVEITDCTNYADIDTRAARASGIVAAANRYTSIIRCTNYGDNYNAFATSSNARIGNISCITGEGCMLVDAVNYGDVICSTSGAAAGTVCLINHNNNSLERCQNYGRIITDRTSYRGTLFGQCNVAATFTQCVAGGDLGTYNNGEYVMVGVDASNYFDYIGDHSAAAVNVTAETIGWNTAPESGSSAAR